MLLASGAAGHDARPGLPGPAPERSLDPVAVNASCERCHSAIAREWRGSKHQRAYVDAAFQASLAREPRPFCRGCHAPEAPEARPPPAAPAELGIGCVTCHVVDGAVLAAPDPARRAPHPVLREPRFAAAGACAGCHEFAFPDGAIRREPEPMQLTVTEHAASPFARVACAGCHMPREGEGAAAHRSHAFALARDPAALQRALRADAARSSKTTARFTLRPEGVGHAFPTGDLFRRLEVRAEVLGPDYAVLASAHRYLARHFTEAPQPLGVHARVVATDDRPGAPALEGAPVVVDLELGAAAAGRPIQYEITYQRVAELRDGREDLAVVESEVVLARGVLPRSVP